MRSHVAAAVLALSLAAPTAPALAQESVAGRWITQDGDAIVEIGRCGETVCGKVVKFLKAPPQGAGQRDVNNPDPKLRSRRLLGMAVLTGFRPYKGNEWKGEIYDPKAGKTYSSRLERADANTLTVKGCIGPFCKSQTWKRAR
ncbi:DUF2147 domain-containing protein [Erythrobacter sp. 3-20A1M]|uniref:DUF2147 domain-containing protein n=1 Tax=Erythrobacter sp. 3-20A1M TaxID=2653850 RepID=UPI001BFC49FA|nr:DUF2147 domain-containing protein [Erythrobacter sp. 3-20A1M]QWC56573.1 DUF2147 domain-containing protein [Erythrobacter sp. 3-20A1M]